MDFSFTEEQGMLRDSVQKFVEKQYDIDTRRKVVAESNGVGADNWALFAELGWLAVPFEEAYGGMSGTQQDTSILMEEFGRGLIVEPYLATVLMFGRLISAAGSDEQKSEYLPKIISGELQGAFAYVERQSGYETSDVATKCEAQGDGFVLNGTKSVVLNGDAADVLIVSARTSGDQYDESGISLFIVDPEAAGVTKQAFPHLDGQNVAHFTFDNVELSADSLLGEQGKGHDLIDTLVGNCVIDLASEAYGIMDSLLKKTVEYVKTREQFGAPIGNFQVVQHRMVDMYVACEEVKSLLYRALCAENGEDDLKRVLYALKYKVEESGKHIWEDAIQFHGGMGMTEEMDVGHYVKRLIMINAMFGDGDHYLDAFIDHTQAAEGQ